MPRHLAPLALGCRCGVLVLSLQAEPGVSCPMSMTFACVPALRHQPDLAKVWTPKICAGSYDGRDIPVSMKTGATMGAFTL